MSTELVKDQIKAFLKTDTPEVLCIRGNWGTGKTYNWQTTVKALRNDPKAVSLNQYAYVSLFGVSSINQIKAGILQNTVTRDRIGDLITSESVNAFFSKSERTFKGAILKLLPVGGEGVFDAAISALSVLSTSQIICFDDLERKAAGLSAGDVLGFMSYLKEERRCKVVLLLNDEALKGDDKDQFLSYLEKVVDINLRFAPTPAESAKIAFGDIVGMDKLKAVVGERSIKLGIDNVRVIRKIFRLVALIEPQLAAYKPGVFKTVVNSLVLFGWCYYQPELAPSLDFVRKLGEYDGFLRDKEKQPDPTEENWKKMLHEYGYGHTDDFDLVLMQGVADGYFKQEDIDAHAKGLSEREQANDARNELDSALDGFYQTFRRSQAEVLDRLYDCFMKNIRFYGLSRLGSLVVLFRELDVPRRAEEMFSAYAEINKGSPGAFDLSSLRQMGYEFPEDLKHRVIALQKNSKQVLNTNELFLRLERDGFHSDVAEQLAQIPVEEYVRVLSTYEGEDMTQIRRGLTAYLNVIDAAPPATTIMDRAGEALMIIAKESFINEKRAMVWGLIQRLERKNAKPAAFEQPVEASEPAKPAKARPQKARAKTKPRHAPGLAD